MTKKVNLKRLAIVGCAYLICLCTIVSLLLSFSSAKYKSLISGYTRFNPEEFNGAIFDGATDEELKSGASTVQSVGSGLELTDCYPGMEPREYDFVIMNGRDISSFATVDVEYAIKVRSMLNLPLEYKLISVSDETVGEEAGGEETPQDVVYDSCLVPRKLKRDSETAVDGKIYGDDNGDGMTNDAYWYEYTFVAPESSEEEQKFVMTGGSLVIRHYVLQVTWPIDEEAGTNSPDYRKEVEMIQLVASMVSVNYQEGEDYGRHEYEEEIHIDPGSGGMLIIDPDHAETVYVNGSDKVYTYGYTVAYRAFGTVPEKTGEYTYSFIVSNGNNVVKYDQSGTRITTQPYEYSYFKILALVPYETDIADYEYTLSEASAVGGGDTVYTGHVVEYRKYDLLYNSENYGTYEVLSEEAAQTLISAAGTDKYKEQYAVYCVYEFLLEPTEEDPEGEAAEYISSFYNGANRYAEKQLTLTVRTGADSIAVENETRRVDYKLTLTTIAVHCDSPMETPAIPEGYSEWAKEGGAGNGN